MLVRTAMSLITDEQAQISNIIQKSMSELEEMIGACCLPGEGLKKSKEIVTALLKRMRESEAKELTVYFCPSDTKKGSALDESFLISCLLFLLIRFQSMKLKLVPSVRAAPKVKKPDVLLSVRVGSNEDFALSPLFLKKAQEMIRQEYMEQHTAALHMDEISIQYAGQSAEGQSRELLKRREEAFEFTYHFYESLEAIFSNRKLFVLKNSINIISGKQNLSSVEGADLYLFAEQAWTKKILALQQGLFIQNLLVKVRNAEMFSEFTPSIERGKEEQQEEDRPQLGFFRSFPGSPCQYLSNIVLTFTAIQSLSFLGAVLKRLPNLSQMRLTKSPEEWVVPEVNGVLTALAKHCHLVEVFWLSFIQVQDVALGVLRTVYEECPYLTELELGLPARYLMEGDDEPAQCGRLLEVMHLRKVSLVHNLGITKQLLAKGYTFNEAIEIVDSIEPLSFS